MSVTANIEKMLDAKFACKIRPVSEVSEKLDSLIERMRTVEQWVSDLEDHSATTTPQMGALNASLKKALDRLKRLENQVQRQNMRLVGLKEGVKSKTPVDFFE